MAIRKVKHLEWKTVALVREETAQHRMIGNVQFANGRHLENRTRRKVAWRKITSRFEGLLLKSVPSDGRKKLFSGKI